MVEVGRESSLAFPDGPMDQFSQDPFSDLSPEDAAAQRAGGRDSLLLSAAIRLADAADETTVRVRNLSTGGLMAEYAGRIAGGDAVEVNVRGVGWVPGRVAWVTDGRIGIAFDHPIDPMLARKPMGGAKRRRGVARLLRRRSKPLDYGRVARSHDAAGRFALWTFRLRPSLPLPAACDASGRPTATCRATGV